MEIVHLTVIEHFCKFLRECVQGTMHRSSPSVRVVLLFLGLAALGCSMGRAQAALLVEEPYGLYGILNPTGHNAVYLQNVCAETPVRLRRCRPGELGAVISRYEGVGDYDWVAIPLIPYLYAVENASEVPPKVDHAMVAKLRNRYRIDHLHAYGLDKSDGSYVPEAWTELIGAAYERRIFAFRFETTPEQDDALIAQLNDSPNRSHFHLLFRNCADFARMVMNNYFPNTFRRSIFPDAGVTTPKQIAYKLVHYARKHPETRLTVIEIPQIPGYRAPSHKTKNIVESFSTTAYALPLTLVNPYLFGGIFVDYMIRGRYHIVPKHPDVVAPTDLDALTEQPGARENTETGAQTARDEHGDRPGAEAAVSGHAALQSGATNPR
jgi:hypothetical protein